VKPTRIGELENGDLFVPAPFSKDSEGLMVGDVMKRIAAGSDEHSDWLRKVEHGEATLVRRDRSKALAWDYEGTS
jgi:hypothetical protein